MVIDSVKEYVYNYEFMALYALWTYWMPAVVCGIVYIGRIISKYHRDVRECSEKNYRPSLTIGHFIGYSILTFTPVLNMIALWFDCAGSAYKWIGKTFDIPLVRKQYKED